MSKIFKRKIEKTIEEYFDDPESPILLIDGARQIGKSYIVRKLGKIHYKHFIEINMVEDKEGDRLFSNIHSTKDLYFTIQAIAGEVLGDSTDTLIFIDEIQEYPHLITMMKFLKEENKYRFIASGSLLGVTLKKTSSIPIGSITIKRMYPMCFEEFLWANGLDEDFIDHLRTYIFEKREVPSGIHSRMMDLFKDYLISGGLPYCTDLFLSDMDIVKVRDAQNEIMSMYVDDASKYDHINKLHTKEIFEMIPSNMENKKKRIFFNDIENKEKARFNDYREDFDDLVSSGIVLKTVCCTDPTFRLLQSAKRNLLKLYMADIGLLTSCLFRYNVRPIRDDDADVNLGNVYESVAAMELSSSGHDLYYYNSKKLGEVDFLIDDYDTLSVIPIEIKSGDDFTKHNAMDNLLNKDERIKRAYVLSNDGNIRTEGRIMYIPIYSLMFL